MPALHPIQRRYLAEDLVRRRRADEHDRYAASQRRGRIDPNPHQIDAVIFALRRIPEGGCILADEVGLGKTIEAGLVMTQLLAEGARRVLIIVPKSLLGQWQDELYTLFGIEAREVRTLDDANADGVLLVGREYAGAERGSELLGRAEPFDLCVIDEAHEIFAGIYKRFTTEGSYNDDPDSGEAKMANRVRGFLGNVPLLLLTATPIQNSLAELWGLVQYVEPTGTLLGELATFRQLFCDGDDRRILSGQAEELRRRIATICQRTLRRQAQEFLEKPFVERRAQLFEYGMSPEERQLYDDVTAYLLEPDLCAFRGHQRRLLLIGFHRRMASSLQALADSLRRVRERLDAQLRGASAAEVDQWSQAFLADLDDFEYTIEDAAEAPPAPDQIRAELERVCGFIVRADGLPGDSKADALLRAIQVVREQGARGTGSGKVVVFTESISTQNYLEQLLIDEGLDPHHITLFRGTNDAPRALEALECWKDEVGRHIPSYNRPSRTVALRLALIHEFKTRSRVFIATEAGAKGLNLQFCDTIINYDLPWNPQRIEQRIGRCHRYSQTHDVTVINFVARDNEAQRLTLQILSEKLDLFGKVLDATDQVLHEPTTSTPELLASAIGADFEKRLHRIYERARSQDDIEQELRRYREEVAGQRAEYEQALRRTQSLIERTFDESVRQSFRTIATEMPASLARLDRDIDRLVGGFLSARHVDHRREVRDGRVFFTVAPSTELPDGLRDGAVVAIGRPADLGEADPLHLGHPLLRAAVEEARAAGHDRCHVRFTIDDATPQPLQACRGQRGRLVVTRVSYTGFEAVDTLVVTAVIEPDHVLSADAAQHLLQLTTLDVPPFEPPLTIQVDLVEDVVDEALFHDQAAVAEIEQRRFAEVMAQLERSVEDKTHVVRQHHQALEQRVRRARDERDNVTGAAARTQAESRLQRLQEEWTAVGAEIERLVNRDDPHYERWRASASARSRTEPHAVRILDVEFVLE